MKLMLPILLLMMFSCSSTKPVDISNLVSREGLVYYNKTSYYNKTFALFNGKGINLEKTPFSGKCVAYYPTGELQGEGTIKEGMLIQSSYLGIDGTLYESSERKGDTLISVEWYSNGQKKLESKTVDGKNTFINRWNENGTIRKELYDWEEKAIEEDNFYSDSRRHLNYIIKKPLANAEKQDILFFMHGGGGHTWYYEPHMINQFSDNYVKVILQAPYETSIFSNKWTWFDVHFSFFGDTTFNEQQINASCNSILFSINQIIEKENINPKKIYVGGNSQGGVMACKLALEHPDAIDGFIAHNAFLPIVYQTMTDKSKYSTLRGLVINGDDDNIIDPINSKQITNTFIKLGANIKSIELQMGHEFPKLSRDLINEWMASK